ncbi:MAG: ABC transporter ATP-binding protein [Candidatus Jettenia caeni]|nr:MAG: ABC transporter ATP-binding protein [Candidatus Jettenia caeni]
MIANNYVVEINNLTKVYRKMFSTQEIKAVDNLSFYIRRGEVCGFLGPNGAGKTTTIMLLMGFLKPTSGTISLLGQKSTHVGVKERIGFLPEESYFYKFFNADEILDYYGSLFRMDAKVKRRRIDELIEIVGLKEARKRRIREYSKGMQRRIGIAQALINDPEFIILDEPTSGLDPIGTRQVKDLIKNLKQAGKTILMSSHLLADVQGVCDRIILLHQGKLIVEGPTQEILSKKGCIRIEVRDTNGRVREQISEFAERNGLKITSVGTSNITLEEFFVKSIKTAGDGYGEHRE